MTARHAFLGALVDAVDAVGDFGGVELRMRARFSSAKIVRTW